MLGCRQRALDPARGRAESGDAARACFSGEIAEPVRGLRRLRQPAGAQPVGGLVARIEVAERVGREPDLLGELRPPGRLWIPARQSVEGQVRALLGQPLQHLVSVARLRCAEGEVNAVAVPVEQAEDAVQRAHRRRVTENEEELHAGPV
jgi:hypothetical protein